MSASMGFRPKPCKLAVRRSVVEVRELPHRELCFEIQQISLELRLGGLCFLQPSCTRHPVSLTPIGRCCVA